MNVILRGIKMPIKCGLCPCFHAEWPMYCQAVKADKDKRIVAPYGMPRPEWCPILIELPAQHGRLIDVEPILKFIINGLNSGEFGNDVIQVMTEIQYAPTIIPAERDG